MRDLLHEVLDAAAEAAPRRCALTHRDSSLTYGEMLDASQRLAAWLAGGGVRRGDRLVVALPVDVLLPPLLFACSRIGAVFVVLGDRLPTVGLAHVLDDCEPVMLLSDSPEAPQLAAERRIVHARLEDLRTAARAVPPLPPVPAEGPLSVDPACLIYTSGSTGMPKAVVSLQSQVMFAAATIQSQLEYDEDDVVYCGLPLAFDYGLYQVILCALARAQLHLASEAAGHGLLVEMTRCRATVLPAVPALAENLVKLLARGGTARPSLRLITNTGAAMPPTLLARLRHELGGVAVQLMFGLTECKRATIMPKDGDLARPGTCGRPLPGTEVFAVSGEGARLPAGETGELVVRGPHVMAGYWRRPELTAERFPRAEGLFPELRTGDYGWIDEDGYLHFVGRRDDLYKERGFRVSTIEVEAAANRVPGVDAAAVLPPRGPDAGATLLVVSDLAPEHVLRRMREQIEEVKLPRRCIVVPQLPRTDNGKLDRKQIATMAAATHV